MNINETGQIEQSAAAEKQPIITQSSSAAEEKVTNQQVPPEAEQLFETFKAAEEETNVKIAKQQDVIVKLQARIDDVLQSQNRQNQTVAACKTLLQSNSYPKLNPLITAFSDSTKKSAEKKNDKIKKLKQEIKKAEKKIKRLKQKQKKNELLKGFVSSLFDKNADRSAFVASMQALREDSLMRAEKKLDKMERTLEKAQKKLADGKLNNAETVKLKARIKKLEGKKSELESKINNLTELDQSLNKLAKTELLDNQFEEIKEATMQNAAGSTTISQAVDGITSPEVTSSIQKAVTGENKEVTESVVSAVADDKTEKTTEEKTVIPEQPPVAEKNDNAQQEGTPTAEKKPAAASKADLRKKDGLSEKEFKAVIDAGIPVRAKKQANDTITVVFDVSQTEKVNQAIESTKTQTMKR